MRAHVCALPSRSFRALAATYTPSTCCATTSSQTGRCLEYGHLRTPGRGGGGAGGSDSVRSGCTLRCRGRCLELGHPRTPATEQTRRVGAQRGSFGWKKGGYRRVCMRASVRSERFPVAVLAGSEPMQSVLASTPCKRARAGDGERTSTCFCCGVTHQDLRSLGLPQMEEPLDVVCRQHQSRPDIRGSNAQFAHAGACQAAVCRGACQRPHDDDRTVL